MDGSNFALLERSVRLVRSLALSYKVQRWKTQEPVLFMRLQSLLVVVVSLNLGVSERNGCRKSITTLSMSTMERDMSAKFTS